MVMDIEANFKENSPEIKQFWMLNFDLINLFLIFFFTFFLVMWSLAVYICLHFSTFEFDRSQQIIQCRYHTILGIRDKTYALEKVKTVDIICHSGGKGSNVHFCLYLNHNKSDSLHLGCKNSRSDLEPIHKIVFTFIFPDLEYEKPARPNTKLSDIFKILRGEMK